jgi:hypothetical protein
MTSRRPLAVPKPVIQPVKRRRCLLIGAWFEAACSLTRLTPTRATFKPVLSSLLLTAWNPSRSSLQSTRRPSALNAGSVALQQGAFNAADQNGTDHLSTEHVLAGAVDLGQQDEPLLSQRTSVRWSRRGRMNPLSRVSYGPVRASPPARHHAWIVGPTSSQAHETEGGCVRSESLTLLELPSFPSHRLQATEKT